MEDFIVIKVEVSIDGEKKYGHSSRISHLSRQYALISSDEWCIMAVEQLLKRMKMKASEETEENPNRSGAV